MTSNVLIDLIKKIEYVQKHTTQVDVGCVKSRKFVLYKDFEFIHEAFNIGGIADFLKITIDEAYRMRKGASTPKSREGYVIEKVKGKFVS